MNQAPTCGSCRFVTKGWNDTGHQLGYEATYCRRYPMQVEKQSEDWCGEYQPAEPTAPSDEQAALAIVKSTAGELQAAADALNDAAKYLRDDGKLFRASNARAAAQRAENAARGLVP